MVKAARAHGSPIMVMAMMTAASAQPTAIQKPPQTIHSRLSNNETGDIELFRKAVRSKRTARGSA